MLNTISNISHLDRNNFFLLSGPCVVENEEITMRTAEKLKEITDKLGIPFIFKASYRKANRSRLDSFMGIGDQEALKILEKVKNTLEVPIVTDIHLPEEAQMAAQVADVLQIPAFLCRQTDLLQAAAETDRVVNIKKGQFLAPESMSFAAQKVIDSGNSRVMLTDRGTMFGYGDLIVDMRGIPKMQQLGYPVVMDITHSLQQPNRTSGVTGGEPDMIATIARAAVAVGCDGIFMETHPNPAKAKSDGANMLHLDNTESMLRTLVNIRACIQA
ncbi:MAG: 3-deoxy-8-phosphooctulonate synthase [Salinivirgaceae bacterium]|jgi:2-dehydro-3-deoxyphosphooctonate aldolase (KDO 8-P synthase)|nr:3-deoxy-8-phosphooctulonate synthase [Salinivirgaceae bacterium]